MVAVAHKPGQVCFLHHADSDRFPMDETAISAERFQGVSDGMSEIEDSPAAGFPFVFRDHLGLDLARARDDMAYRSIIEHENSLNGSFKKGEKLLIGDDPVFDDFSQPRNPFPMR